MTFGMLLLLSQLSVSAQDAGRDSTYPQQTNPLGRIEVPNSDELRRFVEQNSFNNPAFQRKRSESANAESTPSAQGAKQVRIIYLVPADKSIRSDYQSAMAGAISNLQSFYRDQMGGGYTFSLHSPSIEVFQTPHAASFYSTGYNSRPGGFYESVLGDGFALTAGGFDDPNNRWIFYIDADPVCGQYTGGTSGIALLPANDLRGLRSESTIPICPGGPSGILSVSRWIGGLGHELGHAFGLPHPPGCDGGNCTGGQHAYNSLMYIGYSYYPGTYLIDENKDSLFAGGFFSVLTPDPQTPTIQFSISGYHAREGDGHVGVVVNRSDASAEALVDYNTSDAAGLSPCNSLNGAASSRCDYATSVGTLRFTVGEASKTIFVPLVDDSYAEGPESFTLTLSKPSGSNIGTISAATVTIADDDAGTSGNAIDQTTFFVRQHYIDFLGREPDPAAQGWHDILNNCAPGNANCDRIEVSAGFFRSEEFQSRGYFIYRFFSAVGKVPHYSEFVPDFAKVSGFLSPEQLEANKVAFVNEFVARSDYQTKYGSLNNPTSYVDALLQTLGLPNHPSRDFWIAGLINGTVTKAQVLRGIVESAEVYNKYYHEAFVIMQYFGYLRRDADISYLSWIETMKNTGGDYRVMINGFLNSAEYRQRFGP